MKSLFFALLFSLSALQAQPLVFTGKLEGIDKGKMYIIDLEKNLSDIFAFDGATLSAPETLSNPLENVLSSSDIAQIGIDSVLVDKGRFVYTHPNLTPGVYLGLIDTEETVKQKYILMFLEGGNLQLEANLNSEKRFSGVRIKGSDTFDRMKQITEQLRSQSNEFPKDSLKLPENGLEGLRGLGSLDISQKMEDKASTALRPILEPLLSGDNAYLKGFANMLLTLVGVTDVEEGIRFAENIPNRHVGRLYSDVFVNQSRNYLRSQPGAEVPPLHFYDKNNELKSFADYAGKWRILELWHSGDRSQTNHSAAQIAEMNQLSAAFENKGLFMLSVEMTRMGAQTYSEVYHKNERKWMQSSFVATINPELDDMAFEQEAAYPEDTEDYSEEVYDDNAQIDVSEPQWQDAPPIIGSETSEVRKNVLSSVFMIKGIIKGLYQMSMQSEVAAFQVRKPTLFLISPEGRIVMRESGLDAVKNIRQKLQKINW